MNQKIKYVILLILTVMIIAVYVWDSINTKSEIKQLQSKLSNMDDQLKSGTGIMDEVLNIRQHFTKKKNILISHRISGPDLLNEIESLSDLANEMDLNINNLEIDPRNTFPALNNNVEDIRIDLERHSLNFQLSGKFLNVGNFMEILEENSTHLHLQQCFFNLDSIDPKGVVAELQYLTYGGAEE